MIDFKIVEKLLNQIFGHFEEEQYKSLISKIKVEAKQKKSIQLIVNI